MRNKDIRKEVKDARLFLWQVADELSITDSSFSRMLRKELPEERKEEIRNAIKKLKEGA